MKIKNSLEWQTVWSELNEQMHKLPYDTSIRQMLKNIDSMVDDLSRTEVEARRTKVTYYRDEKLSKVNEAIESLDKIIIIGILLS
jgi:hypothetical protein